MLLAQHQYPETYQPLLTKELWQRALTWIKDMPATLPLGEHIIDGQNLYANFHEATLVPREAGSYEAHRNYIDLHYCLDGGEIIEWAPAETLTATTEYNSEKDYQLFAVPSHASTCLLTPGTFAIFFPADAHMPKIMDGKHTTVKKVVIKIKLDLL